MCKYECKFCGEVEIKTPKHAGSHVVNCDKNPNKGKSYEKMVRLGREHTTTTLRKNKEKYYTEPKMCEYCSEVIPYEVRGNKYCGHSCSASSTNRDRVLCVYTLSKQGLINIRNSVSTNLKGVKMCDRFDDKKCNEIKRKISEKLTKPKVVFTCPVCDKKLWLTKTQLNRRKYCGGVCRNKINNKLINGLRSKPEIYLENELNTYFPNLTILFNDRLTLTGNRELDVYIPSLNFGIEWNGIYHYKDIRGDGSLVKTKEKDKQKIKECEILGIKLYIVKDLTSHKKFIIEETNKIIKYINNLHTNGR